MEDEQSIEGSDKSFTRSWKSLKNAVRKRLEPKSRRTSLGSSPGSVTEVAADASQITRSSSSAVKQRMAKGPLSALYKPKPFKAPSTKTLLDEVGNREGSQFELMLDRALSLKRHDSMDLMWRSGDLGLFGTANTQVQSLLLALHLYSSNANSSSLLMKLAQSQALHCSRFSRLLTQHTMQSVSEEDDQVRELIHTERLVVKRASGRAIVNKQYLVINTLGSGQYGKVQLVVNVADLQPYAIKTVSKAKLRTSIRRIRSSLSRHSYSNLQFAATASDPEPLPEPQPQQAPPPPSSTDSCPESASSSAPSSSFAGLPNIPGGELFTSAPPNSRFGGSSRKAMQLLADPPAAAAAATTSGTEAAASPSTSRQAVQPKAKLVSPFAAAAQASMKILTEDTDMAPSGLVSPRLRSTLGGAHMDPEVSSLGTAFGPSASQQAGGGDTNASSGFSSSPRGGVGEPSPFSGYAPTPRPSIAERLKPRPSVERVAQLRGYGLPQDSDAEPSYASPRTSLADRPNGRPSLEHMAHLRGFARANSTPNTGLADSFSLTRCASIRTTPRAADVVQEIAVMKKLNHPNIVRLYEVIDDPSTDSLLLVMEHVDGGSLEQPYDAATKTWDTLPESLVHRHFRELCKGLDYLHYNKALHGDLKPANLLLSSEHLVKIADFGSAMIYQESEGTWEGPVNGTPAFRPPETLTATGRLTRKVDVWAAGVCLFVWVWGCLPFQGDSIPDMFTAIKEKPLTFPAHPECDPNLKDLITKILMKQPEERMSLHEVMQHPWVTCRGTAPLPTVAASGLQTVHVTSQDVSSAISSQNRPSVPTLQSIFKEVNFSAGEILGCDGMDGEYIYLIAQGQVDVLRSSDPSASSEQADADEDDDLESDAMPCTMSDKSVTELVGNFRRPNLGGDGHVWLATRGPGEFVGLHKLALKDRTSRQTSDSEQSESSSGDTVIKARTNVVAFQAPKEAVAAAMSQHPELAEALQSKVIQHMADHTVAEAIGALHMGQMNAAQ